MCPGKEAYSCARMYQCIPETPEFNKAKFGKEIEDLDDLENQIKTGLTNLTLFRGVAIDPKNIDQTTSSVSGCYSGYVLKENLLVSDLNKTQESSVCKDGTIANPFGGWKCELGQTECVDPDDKFYTCNRSFQCVKETPDYNRAKFKQELQELPSTNLKY